MKNIASSRPDGHAFVVLQPHSNTNDSDGYRVVHSHDFMRFTNGAVATLPIFGEFKTYAEAEFRRDELNRGVPTLNR